jgi:hypothetical protein
VARAPTLCAVDGCWRIAVKRGRCEVHHEWAPRNPLRPDGRTTKRLTAQVVERDGYRCSHPEASPQTCSPPTIPLELHHRNRDVADNRLDNLELRCRRHNERGAPLHRTG